VRARGNARRADLRPVSSDGGEIGRLLAPASVHRILVRDALSDRQSGISNGPRLLGFSRQKSIPG
ncbi:MAG: hypothetical protein ACRDWT_06430, partial [Jatrophihabitantaceae bacterium]